jgi:D-psicose/D-tagatose/L-ribulose 3-epimerase
MKLGVNTLIWGASFGPSDFHLLPRIKDAGFDGIEVPILDPHAFEARAVGRELDRIGLELTAVTIIPRGLSLGASDRDTRAHAMQHVRTCLAAARDAGIHLLSGPIYTPVGYLPGRRRTDEEWKWVVDSWQALSADVHGAGMEIGIEPLNRFETYFLNTVADACALCDAIGDSSIGILLDTFHANIEEKSLGEAVRRAAPHLKHLHTCENDRGVPGSGHVEWPAFFAAVTGIGYDGWLTIESFGFSIEAIAAAAAIWRDLAPSVDDIAFEGIRFLRATSQAASDPR